MICRDENKMPKEISKGITVDPKVMAGKPVIKGTRMPVDLVLSKLSANHNMDDLLSDYPELTIDQIKDCLRYASHLVQNIMKQNKRMKLTSIADKYLSNEHTTDGV